ncbi:MAG: hypothetical protein GXZ13_04445 [Synergistaceae bacterium]|nr:hypothetical protein [Synergistaceae bacterium]
MWNLDDNCVIHKKHHVKSFNLSSYIATLSSYINKISEDETWIRSGNFIKEQFKDKISSCQLIGKVVLPEGTTSIEILLIKTQVGVSLSDSSEDVCEFIRDYLFNYSVTSAFTAILPSSGEEYIEYFIASPTFFKVKIPKDILYFMCTQTLKNYIRNCCSITTNDFQFEELYTTGSPLASKANEVEKVLENMEFCDISSGSGEIIITMSYIISKIRLALNSFLSKNTERKEIDYLCDFFSNSLYTTNFDLSALETLRIALLLNYPATSIKRSNMVWGNILIEDLFHGKKFDIIITNPTHMRQELFSVIKDKLVSYYSHSTSSDLYCFFAERAFDMIKDVGCLGLIMSNKWMLSEYGQPLRKFFLSKNIITLVNYDHIRPLAGLSTPLSLLIADNSTPSEQLSITNVFDSDCNNISNYVQDYAQVIDKSFLSKESWNFTSTKISNLINKLEHSDVIPLSEYSDKKIFRGILTGLNKAFIVSNKIADDFKYNEACAAKILRPILSGRDIKRYEEASPNKHVIFMPKGYTNKSRGTKDPIDWLIETHPSVATHLANFEEKARRRSDKGDYWWELRSCKYCHLFDEIKIICPTIVKKLSATIDNNKYLSNDKTIIIACNDYYLLGLLNSKLLDFYFRNTANKLLNDHFELKLSLLLKLPIRKISRTNSFSVKQKILIERCARELSSMYSISRDNQRKISIDKIRSTEKELNNVIYKLYKLTPSEIDIIENY